MAHPSGSHHHMRHRHHIHTQFHVGDRRPYDIQLWNQFHMSHRRPCDIQRRSMNSPNQQSGIHPHLGANLNASQQQSTVCFPHWWPTTQAY
jgi:hypothetical protein